MMPMTDEITPRVVAAIFAYYIEHGTACTRKELAAHSGLSARAIGKAIDASGFWSRVDHTTKSIEIQSRDYPGFVHATRTVDAYRPSAAYMRERFIAATA